MVCSGDLLSSLGYRIMHNTGMYLRRNLRRKDSKEHCYWSVVEARRLGDGRVVQRHVLYLGEINDSQQLAWRKTLDIFEEGSDRPRQIALFPADRPAPQNDSQVVQVDLSRLKLCRPRQWGACWLFCEFWKRLDLDAFWGTRLRRSRKGTRWLNVFKTLTAYRLISPGSEWRLHRSWFDGSAMGDLLDEDFGLVQKDKLYRCLDKLVAHRQELFAFLQERWRDLFSVQFDVLLYDLTSTYFECEPSKGGLRKFGYSRDKRPDCVQVVIALIVTPQGFPIAYEVLAGNTADSTTLEEFLEKIEKQYGKANRMWLMDRGIPTEAVLKKMSQAQPQVSYLVGTPKGRLTKLEQSFLDKSWERARESVEVKLLKEEEALYILIRSADRVNKEQAMRRRRFRKLWKRLEELQKQRPGRDQLLLKLGAAKKEAGRVYSLVDIEIPNEKQQVDESTFRFSVNKKKLKLRKNREGLYLLRSNVTGSNPAELWQQYLLLTQIELAFRDIKGDLSLRPIYHQKDKRIEAHIFVAFMAYCLHVTLKQFLKSHAPGLTPRSIIEKFSSLQMVDVHLPTTDGKTLILTRHTEPEKELQLLLHQLRLELPPQPPPKNP